MAASFQGTVQVRTAGASDLQMRTFISGICFLCLAVNLCAKDFCSLIVKVRSPQGKEVEALVVVEEHDGRRIEQQNRLGGLRFCDLGIMPVTVTVGHPACNQVVVRNVPLDWGETTTLPITYDQEPCLIDSPPVAACKFLFRFIDLQHNFVKGVSLKTQTPYEEVLKADEFGRLMMRIPAGQELLGATSSNGYSTAVVKISCTTENERVERYVTLRKVD